MTCKGHRSGGKFGGRHTTLIPAAEIMADISEKEGHISNITSGFIKMGLPSANGRRNVKFTDIRGGVLLSIRDNTSHQELRVYTNNVHETKLALARGARNNGLHISFGKQAG